MARRFPRPLLFIVAVVLLVVAPAAAADSPALRSNVARPSASLVAAARATEHDVSPKGSGERRSSAPPSTRAPRTQSLSGRASLGLAPVRTAAVLRSSDRPVASFSSRPAARGIVRDVYTQTQGLLYGIREKVLGRYDRDDVGPFHPIEVKDPTGTRGTIVYRGSHPQTVSDIGRIVNIAKARGVTKPSEITLINLRSEYDQDKELVSQYQASAEGSFGEGRIRTVDVKILDTAPPAFYVGSIGWNRAVEKVRRVYQAVKDPTTKVAFIHCKAGRGRTGEMVATAVRIAMDNMSPEDALNEALAHGLSAPWQRAFIQRFARQWQAGKINLD